MLKTLSWAFLFISEMSEIFLSSLDWVWLVVINSSRASICFSFKPGVLDNSANTAPASCPGVWISCNLAVTLDGSFKSLSISFVFIWVLKDVIAEIDSFVFWRSESNEIAALGPNWLAKGFNSSAPDAKASEAAFLLTLFPSISELALNSSALKAFIFLTLSLFILVYSISDFTASKNEGINLFFTSCFWRSKKVFKGPKSASERILSKFAGTKSLLFNCNNLSLAKEISLENKLIKSSGDFVLDPSNCMISCFTACCWEAFLRASSIKLIFFSTLDSEEIDAANPGLFLVRFLVNSEALLLKLDNCSGEVEASLKDSFNLDRVSASSWVPSVKSLNSFAALSDSFSSFLLWRSSLIDLEPANPIPVAAAPKAIGTVVAATLAPNFWPLEALKALIVCKVPKRAGRLVWATVLTSSLITSLSVNVLKKDWRSPVTVNSLKKELNKSEPWAAVVFFEPFGAFGGLTLGAKFGTTSLSPLGSSFLFVTAIGFPLPSKWAMIWEAGRPVIVFSLLIESDKPEKLGIYPPAIKFSCCNLCWL